ncbi:hypothetical protein HDK64DRAFT_328336 [Phyllosticta capitalensis]
MEPLNWKLTSADVGVVHLYSQKAHTTDGLPEHRVATFSTSDGWSPLALQRGIKACLGILIAGTFLTLAGLLIWSDINHGLVPDSPFAQSAFRLVSTTVFVVISYACSGVDDAVQEVAPFRYLWEKSRENHQSISITNIWRIWDSRRSTPLRKGFSQLASTTAVLLMPLLKVVAAGLYSVKLSTTSFDIQPLVDTSLVTHFDFVNSFLENQLNDEIRSDAAQLVEWSQIPQFSDYSRPGTLENLLFSNLTDTALDPAVVNLTGSRATLRAPAISIDITNTQKIISPFIVEGEDSGCWSLLHEYCSDEEFFVGPSSDCFQNQTKFVGMWMPISAEDYASFRTCLVDNSNWAGPVSNTTPITVGEPLPAGAFNVSSPRLMVFNGTVNLTRVFADVTYAHDGKSWIPITFDPSSVEIDEQYSITRGLPVTRHGYNPEPGYELHSETIWPDHDYPENLMQWQALYAEYKLKNLTAILDEDVWMETVKSLIVAYNVELLTAYRPFALENATSQGIKPERINGTLYSHEARIFQDRTTTIILEVFLGTILCCYIWIFCRFPSHSVLPKPPGSIAARLSLLAHSNLVQQIRENRITRITDEEIWSKAALGWWKRIEPKGSEGNTSEDSDGDGESRLPPLRWGIDIGEPVSRRAWNDPPESYNDAQSQNEEYQNGDALPLLEEQADIELQSITKPDQAHGEQLDQQQQQQQEQEQQGISSYDEHDTGSGDQADPPDGESQSDQDDKQQHEQQRNQQGLGFEAEGNFEDWLETQSPNLSLADPRSNDGRISADERSEDSGVDNEQSTPQQPPEDGASSPLLGRKTR